MSDYWLGVATPFVIAYLLGVIGMYRYSTDLSPQLRSTAFTFYSMVCSCRNHRTTYQS